MAMILLLLKLFETCLVGHGCIQLPRKKVERAREDMSRDEAMDEESGKNDTDRSASLSKVHTIQLHRLEEELRLCTGHWDKLSTCHTCICSDVLSPSLPLLLLE